MKTTMRTFARDVNGVKALVQVTEEEKHILPGDDSNIVRVTYTPMSMDGFNRFNAKPWTRKRSGGIWKKQTRW